MDNFRFIITGGPGSGKTSLIDTLKSQGYKGFPEIARDLINQGNTPPIWSEKPDSGRFFELILQQRIFLHQQIKDAEIGFYDRGLPDSIAYLKYQKRPIPRVLTEAISIYRYNPIVFAAPPWEEIFDCDSVRRETFSAAEILYELTIEAYQRSDYQLVVLPKASLETRVSLVLAYCATK